MVTGAVGPGVGRVDVQGEGLGDAQGLLVDQERAGVVPFLAPAHPVQDEAVLLLVRALDQPDPQPLPGIGVHDLGVRLALAEVEPLRRVLASEGQRAAPVVDRHHARVVVTTELAGRVQRPAAAVVERHEVADPQADLPVGWQPAVGQRHHHGLPAHPGDRLLVGQVPLRPERLGDQRREHPVLLPVVGQQVVVEEARPELLVDHPPVQAHIGRRAFPPRPVPPPPGSCPRTDS